MAKIIVIVPYFGGIDYEHLQCMRLLLSLGGQGHELFVSELPHCPWIDIAQAYLAERAMEQGADVIFSIEHDMIFNPQDVIGMSERLLNSDFDMLGALYSQRKPNGLVVGSANTTLHPEPLHAYVPGLFHADVVGLGFTAIKRHVFEELAEVLPNVYSPVVDRKIHPYFAHEISEMYFGQDTSFIRRVKKAGLRIGIDTEPRVFHRGLHNFALEDTSETAMPRYQELILNPKKGAV